MTVGGHGATRRLAEEVAGLDETSLSSGILERVSGVVLDLLASALVGVTRPHVRAAAELVAAHGGNPVAWSLTGHRTSPPLAAYLNSLAGSSAPQLDDVWKESLGHPGVGVVPAALAVAEEVGADGCTLATAILAGYEVVMRIGAALGKEGLDNGWHPRGGVNVFGAAAAAAKLYDLGPTETVHALGLAGNTAAGLTGAVHFHDAWYTLSANASLQGVMAAGLAARGYTAGPSILEATYGGYLTTLVEEPRWSWLEPQAGEPLLITQVSQKVHASSGATHAAIDATLGLVHDHDILPEEVLEVVVHGFAAMAGRLGRPRPTSAVHAGMSVPYLVATAIVRRGAGLAEVVEAPLDDPRVLRLQDRLRVQMDPRLDAMCPDTLGAPVEIWTMDGRRFEREVLYARGDPRNPLTTEELEGKYRTLAGRVLDEERVERSLGLVRAMSDWTSPSDLMALLASSVR